MNAEFSGPVGTSCAPGLKGPCAPSANKLFPGTEYPHGWEKNNHAGMRGPWGSECATELLEHLIYWLEQSAKPIVHDPAGNAYCGVDSNVIRQTLELLRRYQRLLTQPLGQQIKNA